MAAPRQLLVGFDGSPPARAALRRATRIARRNHGCLTVVLVVEHEWLTGLYGLVPGAPLPGQIEAGMVDDLREAMTSLPADISVVSLVRHGAVGPALVREAAARCCDTIVIGTHRGFWSRLTGGVEHYVRSHADCPVVVVRNAPARPPHRQATVRNRTGGRVRV